MTKSKGKSDLPHELKGKLAAFDSALTTVEKRFQPLLDIPQIELNATLSTLDKAKLDLVAAYSINSLFWMYLNVCGVNPKDHGIKQELDRIRSYMNRVKEIQDKEKAPSLNVSASKRFIKSALWKAAHSKDSVNTEDESSKAEVTQGSAGVEKQDSNTEMDTSSKTGEKQSSKSGKKKGGKRKSSGHGGHRDGKKKKFGRYMDMNT